MPTTPSNLHRMGPVERVRRDAEAPRATSGGSNPPSEEPASAWPELPLETIMLALGGDPDALSALFTCYSPSVRAAVAARIRHHPHLHVQFEDLVSEVWLALCKNDRARLQYYEENRGPFGYYLRMVACQIVARLIQMRNRSWVPFWPRHDDDRDEVEDESFESRLIDRDFLQALWKRIEIEFPRDVELLTNVFIRGRRIKALAREMGKSEKALYQQISRLREKIGKLARELAVDPSKRRPGRSIRRPPAKLAVCEERDAGMEHHGSR